jgi:pimeloyl-ACP methyl ester carboxylesterase
MPEIQLSQGTIHYQDEGKGTTILLIHGLLVNGRVWERVVPLLAGGARVIVPDLPLGSHAPAMNADADLSPAGLGSLIAELLERLDLEDVTIVGNDTGGALTQIAVASHPARIARIVLTNCDAFEHFPPPAFAPVFKFVARVPGSVKGLELGGRIKFIRRNSMKLAPLTVDPVPDDMLRSWLAPLKDRGVRRDLVKVARGIAPEQTLAAAEQLRGSELPALIVWGTRDRFFPLSDAERLAALFADARIEKVPDARAFVQLDQPKRLAELVLEHVRERAIT